MPGGATGGPQLEKWRIAPAHPELDFGLESLGWDWFVTGDYFRVPQGWRNAYGLLLKSVKWPGPHEPHSFPTALPGDIIPTYNTNGNLITYFFEMDTPQLTNVSYYFARPFDDPRPGEAAFHPGLSSPTNLIIPFGSPFFLTAWAKQAISNGYTNKFAFAQQYFEGAYRIDAAGNVTTNKTGILSPYGDFFPTDPGAVALVTMPDGATGQRGTGTLHVIKLQLDVNHDGAMDLSFAGPDNTSQSRPFVFWVNDDWDFRGWDVDAQNAPRGNDYSNNSIGTARDLEDMARLWIAGLPALSTAIDYSVTLSWRNTTETPAVTLFRAYETNGGIGYLSDTNIAAAQALPAWDWLNHNGYGDVFERASSSQPLTFPTNFFAVQGTNSHFLFEAAGVGSGELVLTVLRGTNVLSETSAWLDLRRVADMYERASATNVPTGLPPSTQISGFKVVSSIQAGLDEERQLIVFVHGINNTEFDYKWTSETMFKRLYWAGYQGRFASFRWQCAYLPNETSISPLEFLKAFNYNKGEFYALKAATGFRDYLRYFTNRLQGYTLNIIAHSQGSCLAAEAINQGSPWDSLILSQGAFPAHAFDTNAPHLQKLVDAETNNPTPFDSANGGYDGSMTNLSGNVVNFFNAQDYALATGARLGFEANWERNQEILKPADFRPLATRHYWYVPATSVSYRSLGGEQPVSDWLEVRSMVARSRTKAIGAQPGLGAPISSSVDLESSFEFGNTREEHSAQFTRSIQSSRPYYRQVLQSFNIPVPLQ